MAEQRRFLLTLIKRATQGKEFPKGMLCLAVMVAVCAILGSLAMGMMFDSRNIPDDLMTNGQYYAFQKLGEYYNMGNTLMVIYAIANTPGTSSCAGILD